ncbi:5'/3'-nucleotidase SurE [bacterium]|nr:5'/3'-nucleotidase SurE [bacterium]
MRIIITNDDGIKAPGLAALAAELVPFAEVTVLAPERERSAISHAITLREPIILKKQEMPGGVKAYAASGTPADCMKVALLSFCDMPDVALVGLNAGTNLSTDIVYSGTVAAASEACMLGVPALALSLDASEDGEFRFDTGARAAREIIEKLDFSKAPEGLFLNVNIPGVPWEEVKGYRLTKLGKTKFHERYIHRVDPSGNDYFWISGVLLPDDEDPASDYLSLKQNFISVTPIMGNFASPLKEEEAKEWLRGLFEE